MTPRPARILLAFATLLALSRPASAEVAELVLTRQYGLSYLTFEVMREKALVEKQLAAAGLAATKVNWTTLSDGAVQNDALLSGTVHVAGGGIGLRTGFGALRPIACALLRGGWQCVEEHHGLRNVIALQGCFDPRDQSRCCVLRAVADRAYAHETGRRAADPRHQIFICGGRLCHPHQRRREA